jgi:hypothetical protein
MINKIMGKIRLITTTAAFLAFLFVIPNPQIASALDPMDPVAIGLAYTTHIFFHELGHQVVADEVGLDSHQMDFFTRSNGKFYMGLSTYQDQSLPDESKLPYAVGGEWMSSFVFEYAFQSYRQEPTAFNKALMLFSGANFLGYTLMANYISPDNDMYAPNIIREETGCSKEMLLSIVAAKTLLNAYRVMNQEANFAPAIWVDKKSAGIGIHFTF